MKRMMRLDWVRRAILKDLTPAGSIAGLVLVVAVPTVARALLGPSTNPVPFVTYFPAMLLGAIFLGWRWAAVATLISAVIVNRVFLAKPWLENPAPADVAILVFFVLSCALLILTGHMLRQVVRDMDRLGHDREVMSREMYHRVQNTLAIVDGLVRMASKAGSVDEFRNDLSGRIRALSHANRVLQTGAGTGSDVHELIRQATGPFERQDAFTVEGPEHRLPAEAGHHLLLILHELCTNALKHGALSVPGGRVVIEWQARPEGLHLEWREQGGPPVKPPARRGLGTRLLASQQGFSVDVRYEPAGVICAVEEKSGSRPAEAAA